MDNLLDSYGNPDGRLFTLPVPRGAPRLPSWDEANRNPAGLVSAFNDTLVALISRYAVEPIHGQPGAKYWYDVRAHVLMNARPYMDAESTTDQYLTMLDPTKPFPIGDTMIQWLQHWKQHHKQADPEPETSDDTYHPPSPSHPSSNGLGKLALPLLLAGGGFMLYEGLNTKRKRR